MCNDNMPSVSVVRTHILPNAQGGISPEIPAHGDLYFQPHTRWIYQLPKTWTQVLLGYSSPSLRFSTHLGIVFDYQFHSARGIRV